VLVGVQVILSLTLRRGYALTAFGDITQALLTAFAAVIAWINVRVRERRAARFWVLISLGCSLWLCSQILWTYVEVFQRTEAPNPFIGDVILFVHLVPMMGALALQPHMERDQHTARLGTVDFALLLTWWLYLYLYVVIPWQYVNVDTTIYGKSFNTLYFVEHVVFLASAALVWSRASGPWRVVYRDLMGAGLLYGLASISASIAIDKGTYYTGSLYDIPLMISIAMFVNLGINARALSLESEPVKTVEQRQEAWAARLAGVVIISLPVLAAWALYANHIPPQVRAFRILLTLAAIMAMGLLLAIKQYRMDKELDRANHELREASLTDLLTGAKNRRFLANTIDNDIRQVIRAYSRNTEPQAQANRDLIFYLIDADDFKEINDRFGHDQGDVVLIEIARRISSAIRYSDVLIRWGGEEFLVVSRYTNRREADALAARVLTAVGEKPFRLKGGVEIFRTCSVGWAAFPWIVESPNLVPYTTVLRLADDALYQAKKSGKNQAIGMLPREAEHGSNAPAPIEQGDAPILTRTLTTRGPQTLGQQLTQRTFSALSTLPAIPPS
jgi:diguanylate cyclase (GGDEF)-like protein